MASEIVLRSFAPLRVTWEESSGQARTGRAVDGAAWGAADSCVLPRRGLEARRLHHPRFLPSRPTASGAVIGPPDHVRDRTGVPTSEVGMHLDSG